MMSSSNAYKILLESRGNKFCIYFENSAIYCKTIDSDGKAKEIILVDSVYDNFFCSKSQEDNIYLLCLARNKNFLLFIYDGQGWHMEELNLRKAFGNIIPLGLFALADGINIIFAKKLTIEGYYDIYQLKKGKDDWEKIFVCEMYSRTPRDSMDIKMGFGMLHMITALYDGENLFLKYYYYNIRNKKWLSIPIVNLNNTNINIKASIFENKLNLFCYSIGNNVLDLFYFAKQVSSGSSFSLVDIIKISPAPKDLDMVIELNNEILKVSYVEKNFYIENLYNMALKKWEIINKIPLKEFTNLNYIKLLTDSFNMDIEEKELLCSISDNLELYLPENKTHNDTYASVKDEILNPNAASLILDQIELLSEKIEDLNGKINEFKEKEYSKEIIPLREKEQQIHHEINPPILKESNFKERFMKAKPTSIKFESSTVLSGESIELGMILPQNAELNGKHKIQETEEIEETEEDNKLQKLKVIDESSNKSKGIIKKFSDWFK